MLTGPEIERQIALGRIVIYPLHPECVGPNSVDLHLADELLVYTGEVLTTGKANPTRRLSINGGLVLDPGELYLGRTVERTMTPYHVPQISGRSSVGRLGINIHSTAGFGDVGFSGTWTLEISVVKPVRIERGLRICQIYFTEPVGEIRPYAGRYQGQTEPTASRIHLPTPAAGPVTPPVRVVAGLLRSSTVWNAALMGMRGPFKDRPGCWEFPGGKVEPGETDEQALQREWLEELSALIYVGRLLGTYEHRSIGEGAFDVHLYEVSLLDGTPTAGEAHADIACVVLDPQDWRFPKKVTPSTLPLIAQLQK